MLEGVSHGRFNGNYGIDKKITFCLKKFSCTGRVEISFDIKTIVK